MRNLARLRAIAGWLESRTGLGAIVAVPMAHRVPRNTASWAYVFGSATLILFVLQIATGICLALVYVPSPDQAYESLEYLNYQAALGWYLRAVHFWGSNAMVLAMTLHMIQVFLWGAHKYPRELTWVIGVVLLILTLTMGFTGYLLPFDQKSYWASVVGVNINSGGPFIGPFLSDFLRGGNEFGATTLSRFYSIHMLLIPGAIIALIGAHLYLVTKLGTTAPPWGKPEKGDPQVEVERPRVEV